VVGTNNGNPWRIGTSGTAIRGQHVYNPHHSEKPIQDIVSLTVIGPNVYEADRFATAAFAMGKRSIYFIEQLPGFEGYMIDTSSRATYSSNFERFVLNDDKTT
jgi:FAD:protein FMN transferase